MDVPSTWSDSPRCRGIDDVGFSAPGHGIGLGHQDRPFCNQHVVQAGVRLRVFTGAICQADKFHADEKGNKNGVRLKEKIPATKDGSKMLRLWPIDALKACWLPKIDTESMEN